MQSEAVHSESAATGATSSRWFLFAFLAWTVLATIPTSSAYIAEGSLGFVRWLWIFGKIAPYYYMWALATPLIYRLSLSTLNPRRGLLVTLPGHFLVALSLSVTFGFLLHLQNWKEWLIGSIAPGYYAMSGFSYIFILLGIYLYKLQARVRKQESMLAEQRKQALELEASLARSQVERLRGQMNPHFLFNALNCIGALIETRQNERAYQALEDLGALLRTSLEHRDQELVPLDEELTFSRRYLAMEQMRFGDRVQMQLDVDSAARQWPIPPFLLQPLIENVVRHAVAPSHKSVTIELTARRSATGIEILVSDNGAGNRTGHSSNGTGVGLENLRRRLDLIYGREDLLEFSQDESGTRVRVSIPEKSRAVRAAEPETDSVQQSPARLQTQH